MPVADNAWRITSPLVIGKSSRKVNPNYQASARFCLTLEYMAGSTQLQIKDVLAMKSSLLLLLASFLLVAFVNGGLSVFLEFSQYWFPTLRTVSQRDIHAQIIGSCVGSLLWLMVGSLIIRRLRRWTGELDGAERLDGFLTAIMVLHLILALLPFDLTIRPAEIWHKFKAGGIRLTPFVGFLPTTRENWFETIAEVVRLVLIGWLAARLAFRRWQRPPGMILLLLGGGLFCGCVEFLQIFVASHTCDINDILFGAAGFLLGGMLFPVRRTGMSERPTWLRQLGMMGVLLLYVAGVFCFFWHPFQLDLEPAHMRERAARFIAIPFHALFAGSYLNALNEIVRKNLIFACMALLCGFCFSWQVTSLRRWTILFAIFSSCASVGLLIELGQILFTEHFADTTDVLLYCMGSAGGTILLDYLFPVINHPLVRKGRT